MHEFGKGNVVERPGVGLPIGGGQRVERGVCKSGGADGDVRYLAVDVFERLPGLEAIGQGGVNGVVDGPQSGLLMGQFPTKGIAEFGMSPTHGQPEQAVRCLFDVVGLRTVWQGILSEYSSKPFHRPVCPVHVGGTVRHGAPAVLQRITGPDGGISIVESIAIRIEISFLPGQVQIDDRPHFLEPGRIARPQKMVEHLIEEHQVHVVMMGAQITTRITGDVPGAERTGAEFFEVAGQVQGGVHDDRCGEWRLHLRSHVSGQMRARAVVPTQDIGHIGAAPSVEAHPPGDGTVHERRMLPYRIGRDGECGTQRIDVRIRCLQHDLSGASNPLPFGLCEDFRKPRP